MELSKFMGVQIHLGDKNEIYQQKYFAAIGGNIKLEEVDALSQSTLLEYYEKGLDMIQYDLTNRLDSFELEGIHYRITPYDQMTVENWIGLEETLEANDNPILSYPGLLCILTKTKNPGAFSNLDHTIAMPLIAFFLLVYQKFDQNILAYIGLNKITNQTEDPELRASLTELIQAFTKF